MQTVIITGPSGSGKTTLAEGLRSDYSQTYNIPTGMSSRAMRPGESMYNPYIFTTSEICLATPAFNRVHYLGNHYCMPWAEFREDRVNLVVLEVDGAKKLTKDHLVIYVERDQDLLVQAIRDRGSVMNVEIARLAQLEHELSMASEFSFKVCNSGSIQSAVTSANLMISHHNYV